jgi:hypothetical protein
MKLEQVFPETIKDYGTNRWRKRFYRNFPVEKSSRRRRYDYYGKHIEQPKIKQPKPEPKQPKALIQNNFVLQELSSGYQSKIYGKFLLSTGEKVVMQIKAHLVVDYINSKIPNTNVFVLGPGDQLYLKGSKEYQWHLAKSDKISSKNLVPGFVYWCATVLPHFDRSKEKEITESQKLYLGKIKMTGVSQRQYEMVDLWYDMGDCLYSRHALPKQQLYKFGEPEQNVIKGLKEEGERVLVGEKTT